MPTDTLIQSIASSGGGAAFALLAAFTLGACATVALGIALDRRDAREYQQRLARSVNAERRRQHQNERA